MSCGSGRRAQGGTGLLAALRELPGRSWAWYPGSPLLGSPSFGACHGQNKALMEKECMCSSSDARRREQSSCVQVFQGQQAGAVDTGHISHGLSGELRALTGKHWVKGWLPEWLDNGSLAGRPASHIRVPEGLHPRNPAPEVFPALWFGNDHRSAARGREGRVSCTVALPPLPPISQTTQHPGPGFRTRLSLRTRVCRFPPNTPSFTCGVSAKFL